MAVDHVEASTASAELGATLGGGEHRPQAGHDAGGHEFAHPKHGYPLQVHEIDLTEYEG
ncbi:hypothetical protein ACFVZD_44280 [Streptomyces sp. NPDC058287]|uniref:hypothetical protein n=1 Tax=unclassified Streptomyces TaxID=2593676 RepID=UPI0036E7F892